MPYYDVVGPDPSYEEMSQVVAVKKFRPTVLKQEQCEQYEVSVSTHRHRWLRSDSLLVEMIYLLSPAAAGATSHSVCLFSI